MEISAKVKQWFSTLEEDARNLPMRSGDVGKYVPPEHWQKWATSADNAIQRVFGPDSSHSKNFRAVYAKCSGWEHDIDALRGVFYGAKSDLDGGYLFSVEAVVAGEVFGDFVVMAKMALGDGHTNVAAVLASAALEDALKKYATLQGLNVEGKSMPEVVGALKSKGLVSGAQKSLLDTMPKVRNFAMHADWEKLTPQDVGSVIGFVEQFLISHFSG